MNKKLKSLCLLALLLAASGYNQKARADFFGGDLPLLFQIVNNTLNTLKEMQVQSDLLKTELRGINDKINRVKAINELLNPEDKEVWKNPVDALKRLQSIYSLLPPEYKTEKSKEVERQISQALLLAEQMRRRSGAAFNSGQELEKKSLDSGPAVANKLTASGVGTLVTLQAQNQVAQSTIISLLSQMIVEGASKEAALAESQAAEMRAMSRNFDSGMAAAIRSGSGGVK